ncbi:hypothetical protein [Arcticibacter eurypsychrophilus]|uniref:hypothetical protein n=1 Tax=Arcticibacter eurypsychrophilus TaxID=1434752 RepID=UPI00084D0BDE|nr:hypothetical protein [Arcticibacter eurypsychrophilus]
MKKIKLYIVAAASFLAVASIFAFKPMDDIKGWFLAGSNPDSYEIGLVKDAERNGNVAFLKSKKTVDGFGTIMQSFNPSSYLGKRVRLSGYIKSKDVKNWAGMWFRIDGPDKANALAFDNMQKRPITGNTAWKKYEIVLETPENATGFAFGVLQAGPGEVWLDDLKFEVVDKSVPLTNILSPTVSGPQNLDFEESK